MRLIILFLSAMALLSSCSLPSQNTSNSASEQQSSAQYPGQSTSNSASEQQSSAQYPYSISLLEEKDEKRIFSYTVPVYADDIKLDDVNAYSVQLSFDWIKQERASAFRNEKTNYSFRLIASYQIDDKESVLDFFVRETGNPAIEIIDYGKLDMHSDNYYFVEHSSLEGGYYQYSYVVSVESNEYLHVRFGTLKLIDDIEVESFVKIINTISKLN